VPGQQPADTTALNPLAGRRSRRDQHTRRALTVQYGRPMSEEIRIRPVAPDDLPFFFEHQADAEAARMATVEPRDWASFEDHWAKILRDERAVNRAVEADGVVVGYVVSWEHEGEREVGYWIGREHWGRGVATAALAAFVAEVTERPLFAHVVDTNAGSIRVLEKCGFRSTGNSTVAADGVLELLYRLDGTD
jgi:RimJ/RimL family protein N-acetyltransferase